MDTLLATSALDTNILSVCVVQVEGGDVVGGAVEEDSQPPCIGVEHHVRYSSTSSNVLHAFSEAGSVSSGVAVPIACRFRSSSSKAIFPISEPFPFRLPSFDLRKVSFLSGDMTP